MDELTLNLQKQEALEKEIQELETKAAALSATDKGLEDAVSAKKKQLTDLNAEVARLKAQDTGNFERARNDNVNAAFSRLVATEPDLQNAELQVKLKSAFGKFDEGHFNADEIYKDLRFAWMSLNREKVFSTIDAFSAMPEEVRKQQEAQLAGAGARSGGEGAGSGNNLTEMGEAAVRNYGVSPDFIKKNPQVVSDGPAVIMVGGILKGTEKAAA